MLNSSSPDIVVLRGGVTTSVADVIAAIEMESRGIRLSAGPSGSLFASPRSALTDFDRDLIRRLKSELITVATYEPSIVT